MSTITLNLPTLVRTIEIENKPQYYLRPLFFSNPVATDRRFEKAVSKFQKEIRHYFRGFHLIQQNSENLLWFLFNPKVTHKRFRFAYRLGIQTINGEFAASYFELQDKIFVTLPMFDNFMFIAEPDEKGKYNLDKTIYSTIEKLLRKLKKENQNNNIDITPYLSKKEEFITNITVNITIEEGKFPFEYQQDDWFFSRLSGNVSFDGATELEKVGANLNELYPSELKRAFFRDDLIERLHEIIYQKENTPIVIIGKEGVGKHSLIHETVFRYRDSFSEQDFRYEALEQFWLINPNRIIAGMSIVGMWQKRFETILMYIQNRRKQIDHLKYDFKTDKILIDNPIALLRIGKSSQNDMTLSDVLKPYLEKRKIQMVLIATPEEWKIVQEKDRRFADLFQTIRLEEPSAALASKMVLKQRKQLELDYNCQIGIQAINQLFVIHRNYLKRKALPGSVMKILRQLTIKHKFGTIDAEEVRAEFQDFSGMDQEIFDDNYTFEEEEVRDKIAAKLIGQEAAAECLSDVINIVKAKLNNPEKPLSSFMFIGPTGVGKTQAAKVLTEYLMGNADEMIRFDMNEYIDSGAVQRLIGDYYNPEGQLTGKVRYRPFGVLLLDEIEKAHPKVHDLLLQVLDDGRLTDSLGRTVDFSNMIIIMTSNIGARNASMRLGFKTNETDETAVYRKAVENHFRPEFINRIDKIVIFNPLELPHILNIARLQIDELLRRDGFVRRTTLLNISQDAVEWVARRGFDAQMGGRALKRQIERDLTALSADQLIGTYTDKPIIFEIGYDDNHLIPNILPLEFEEQLSDNWLPEIPAEKQAKRFYRKLLNHVEDINDDILDMEDEGSVIQTDKSDLDWQSYAFKDKVAEIKEMLQTAMLGFSNPYFIEPPTIPFRLKRIRVNIRGNYKNVQVHERQVLSDKFFQKDAFEELREGYHYGIEAFDRAESQLIQHYLDVAFLELAARGFLNQKSDKVTISFESKINNQGDEMIDFLFEQYQNLLKGLDLDFKIDKNNRTITAENHSLYELLKGEHGIHLFYLPYQNPIPIFVKITAENEENLPFHQLKVIRFYDGLNTLTDLRTGLTNAVNMNVSEFRLLLFAGLEMMLRKDLI